MVIDMASSITILKNKYALLSKAERAIADCVFNDPDTVALLSVAELADQAGVAPQKSRVLGFYAV